MFSKNFVKNFLSINTVILGLAYIKYSWSTSLVGCIIVEGLVNYSLLYFLTVDKPLINACVPKEQFRHEFDLYAVSASVIKGITHWMLTPTVVTTPYWVPLFILTSMGFELTFDFCHYWVHKLSHNVPWLYRFHKIHHKFKHPCALTTFYMHPVDLILSYSLPFLVATTLLNICQGEFYLITVYLTYQEIAGHLGKKMYPTSCFAQCIWLPRVLGIELYTEDHALHHAEFKWNYGKRFSLYDRIFKTFKSGV